MGGRGPVRVGGWKHPAGRKPTLNNAIAADFAHPFGILPQTATGKDGRAIRARA